jgi:hypothetical protein
MNLVSENLENEFNKQKIMNKINKKKNTFIIIKLLTLKKSTQKS